MVLHGLRSNGRLRVKDDADPTSPALRTHHAVLEVGEQHLPAPSPDQRLQVQPPRVVAFPGRVCLIHPAVNAFRVDAPSRGHGIAESSTSQAASRFSRVTFNPSDVIQPGGDRPMRPISAALAAAAPWSKGRCAAIPLRGPPFRSSFAISSPRSTVTIGRVRAPSLIVARTRKAGTSQATKTQSRSSFIARSRS